jgi:hypothetical protein
VQAPPPSSAASGRWGAPVAGVMWPTVEDRAKYDKAVACLTKDRDALLTFFDFPAEHWDHLRTPNPIAVHRTTWNIFSNGA